MLALPMPFGLGQKSVHISIRVPNERALEARLVAVEMRCPVFVADRVEQCIRYSGRYDCLVTTEVDIDVTRAAIEKLGGTLESIDMNDDEKIAAAMYRQPSLSREMIHSASFFFPFLFQGLENDKKWRAGKKPLTFV